MKKTTIVLPSSFLLFVGLAFLNARTTANAPASIEEPVQAIHRQEAIAAKNDATSEIRRKQLNADIRAREQRNNIFNGGRAENRIDSDLESEIRSKLEANLPASALVVKVEDSVATISGTVPSREQYRRIKPLAKEIKGVRQVNTEAIVTPALPLENI